MKFAMTALFNRNKILPKVCGWRWTRETGVEGGCEKREGKDEGSLCKRCGALVWMRRRAARSVVAFGSARVSLEVSWLLLCAHW
jgi:hypothetical protein